MARGDISLHTHVTTTDRELTQREGRSGVRNGRVGTTGAQHYGDELQTSHPCVMPGRAPPAPNTHASHWMLSVFKIQVRKVQKLIPNTFINSNRLWNTHQKNP